MSFINNVTNALSNTIVRTAENVSVANSSNKLLKEFSSNENAKAIISITVQRRRIGHNSGERNAFDEETFELGFEHGQKLSKINYLGFEKIYVNNVIIMPGTDLIITNQNRFLHKSTIHNGTETSQQKHWMFFKPMAFEITCVKNENLNNSFIVDDSKLLDGRLWTMIFAILIIILIIVLICWSALSNNKGESFNVNRLFKKDN